jgi:F-type H+-transporting ATPase subunit epsilon
VTDKLWLRVITPSSLVVDEEVDEVLAPGEIGEFGILPGHVPFITLLAPGELIYRKDGTEKRFILLGGILEVKDDKVKVLTEFVEDPSSIDPAVAKKELEAVMEELKGFGGSSKELKELTRKLKLAQIRAGIG